MTPTCLFYCSFTGTQIWSPLRSKRKKAQNIPLKIIDIREAAKHSEQTVLPQILAIHAWGGFDTTSVVFGHGKCRILKLAQQSQEVVRQWCALFAQEDANRDAVGEAGERIFISMYGGKPDESLTKINCDMLATGRLQQRTHRVATRATSTDRTSSVPA